MENNLLKTNDEQSLGGVYFSVTVILLLVANIIFSVVVSATGNVEQIQGELWYTAISFSLSGIVIIASALLFSRSNGFQFVKFCGFNKTKGKYYLLAIVTFLAIFFGLSTVNLKFIEFLQRFGYKYQAITLPEFSPLSFITVILTVCVLPAVAEEIAFRNILLNGIKTGSVILNATIGGFLFAIYHMNPAQTPYQFIIGFAFSLIAIKSRSVLPTVIAHFLNNLSVVLIEYFYPPFSVANGKFFIFTIAFSLASLVAVIVLLVFDKNDAEKQEKGGVKKFFVCSSLGVFICLLMWLANFLV